jgi:hypothetical protein
MCGDKNYELMKGAKVSQLIIDENEDVLIFITDKGVFKWVTYGDCCSHTWFADIIGVECLINHVIQDVHDIDIPESYNLEDGRCKQEVDSAYGVQIVTERGYCDIIFRNSSNGYYGGNIKISYDPKENSLNNLEFQEPGCVDIHEDWSGT